MKRIGPVFLLLCLFLCTCLAESGDWQILKPGWWNASRESIVAVRDQLQLHILWAQGQDVQVSEDASTGEADWSILEPGWWDMPLESIQAVEQQLSNHIDVLDGRLIIAGTQDEQPSADSTIPASTFSPSVTPVPDAPSSVQIGTAINEPVSTISPALTPVPASPLSYQANTAISVPETTIPAAPILIQNGTAGNAPVSTVPPAAQIGSNPASFSSSAEGIASQTPSDTSMSSLSQMAASDGSDAAGTSPEDDSQAYTPIDFDAAFNNPEYIGKKTILNGKVASINMNAQTISFTIRQSNTLVLEIQYPRSSDFEPVKIGNEVSVLGVIRENNRIERLTNLCLISIMADYVEVQ
ncbi:MAG: hypothetical protein IJT77_08845 [Clostridia bacterium]|nr:hypothetical protein [Clostridia bacterium]